MKSRLHINLKTNVSTFSSIGNPKLYHFDKKAIPNLVAIAGITEVQIAGYDKAEHEFFMLLLRSLSKSIEIVDISGNQLKENVIDAAKILVSNTSIYNINVANNWLGQEGGLEAAKIFAKSSSLRIIDMRDNFFEDHDKKEILSQWQPKLGQARDAENFQVSKEIGISESTTFESDINQTEMLGSSTFADLSVEILM